MTQTVEKRSNYFDNIKGILIILVVLGHCLFDLQEFKTINYIVDTIYVFHMPAFVFMTGYLSKSSHCREKATLLRLFCAYIIFNTLMMLYHSSAYGTSFSIMSPYNSCWYLLAVIVWRFSVGYFEKVPKLLLVAVVAAFAIGLFPDVTNVMAAARIVAFYPFFLAGYEFDTKRMTNFYENRKIKQYIHGIAFLFIAIFLSVLLIYFYHPKDDVFQMAAYVMPVDILIRCMIFFVSILAIIGLFLCVPKRKVLLLTNIGKNTLPIFLLHRIITLIISNWMQRLGNEGLIIFISLIETTIIVVLCGTNFIASAVSKLIDTFYFMVTSEKNSKGIEITRLCTVVIIIFILALQVLLLL